MARRRPLRKTSGSSLRHGVRGHFHVAVRIPLSPEFIDANTATGQYVVERDRYVDS